MSNMNAALLKSEMPRERGSLTSDDQQKLIEGQLQLEGENEARARRVKLRKQSQLKMAAKQRAKRRARTFKLAGFWTAAIAGGLFAMTWYSGDIMGLIGK